MSDEAPIRGRTEQAVPTLRDIAAVLFRQRKAFTWAWGLVFAACVLYAFVGVKYQANMKVLVRRGRADAPVSAGESAPLDLTRTATTEEDLNSEVELLRDDEVLRKVVETTGASGAGWFHFPRLRQPPADQVRAETVERGARQLAKKLKVEPIKRTNLIAISYAADDPRDAAKVLQSLASVYLEKHMAVHRPTGESGFFEQQITESRRQLEDSQRAVFQFSATHRVVAAAQQRDLALQKWSELDSGDRQAKIEIAQTRRRVLELAKLLSRTPERTTTQVRTADNPELMKALKASLLDLQLKRTQLLTKFEPNHRLVQEIEQQIVQAQSAIAAENVSPIRDETTDKNTHYEWAKAELEQAQIQLEALHARETAGNAQAAAIHGMAEKLGHDAVTQEDLLSREKAAEESYLLYVKKREEARMNDALDQRGIVNVAIAEQPAAPALPLYSMGMILLLGFVGAGAAATGAAFTADYLDTGFRNPDDVTTYLDAPVLASLPKKKPGRLSA